jgi:hypothetical protein
VPSPGSGVTASALSHRRRTQAGPPVRDDIRISRNRGRERSGKASPEVLGGSASSSGCSGAALSAPAASGPASSAHVRLTASS